MHRLSPLPCLCLLFLLLLADVAARAQGAASGALGGVVADASGAAIPNATVQLHSADANTTQTTATDREGEFHFGQLPPGDYSLRISASGFDTLQVEHTAVEVGRSVRLAPSLTVAGPAQTIQVDAVDELPAFDSPVNATLSPEDLQDLPQDGRRFQSLAPLTPLFNAEDGSANANSGNTPSSGSAGNAGANSDSPQLSVRGLSPVHNSYGLDGLNLTRAFDGEPRGGRSLPFTVAQEAVREFGVRAVGAGTRLGRDTGGFINTVTKRGGPVVHGSAFFLLRNSAVGAANPFAVSTHYNNGSPTSVLVKPRDQREQFGGSIGGPLVKNKLFGFVAAEGQRRSFPAESSPSDPAFYSLTAEQTALLGNRGVGTAATASALRFLDSLTGTVDRHADELALMPRLDWQPTARTAVAVEWVHVRFNSPAGRTTQPVEALGRGSFNNLDTHMDTVLLHASHALSPRWLVQLRGLYSRDAQFADQSQPLPQEPATGPGGAAPEVSIAGDFTFGSGAALGQRRLPDERRTEGAADIAYNGRAHTVTVGVDASGIDERIDAREGTPGAYSYTSSTTSGHDGGLVDFITDYTYNSSAYPNGGCPSVFTSPHYFCFDSFTQVFGAVPETRFHTAELTVFADDSWRVSPHLRIDAGVRYEWNRLPPPQHPNATLDAALATALGAGVASTTTVPSDTNNLAPHAGFAYAPAKGTVVRASYGYHFGRVPGRALQQVLENTAQPDSQTRLRLTPRTIINPACASSGTNFGYPATYTCSPFGPLAAAGAATVFTAGFQMPAVQTGELSVSQQLGSNTTISGSYIVALARQLTNSTDLNIAPSTSRVAFTIVRNGGEQGARGGETFNVPLYTERRTPLYGPITGLSSNATGTYNALALQVEHRMGHGLYGRASWTYAKALDTVRSTRAAADENAQFDPFQPLYDRAPANYDHRHRVVLDVIWRPTPHFDPGGQTRWLQAVAKRWSISAIALATSGRPYGYNITGGTALTGGRESLNGSGGANYLPSVGRNTLRLPWTQTIDLRVGRTLLQRDRTSLHFTAEAFNLLNHVNLTAVEQRAFLIGAAANNVSPLVFQDAATIASEGLTSQAFGTPTSSADSPARERRVQFGLRLQW